MKVRGTTTTIVAVAIAGASIILVIGLWTMRGAPPRGVERIAAGRFHRVAHLGTGLAAVHRLPDHSLVLRLTEFRTDEGRDLQVLLIAAPDALENETVEKSESLLVGPLERAEGDQSYALPDQLDLARYRAVTIWSSKHRVNFITAPLTLEGN